MTQIYLECSIMVSIAALIVSQIFLCVWFYNFLNKKIIIGTTGAILLCAFFVDLIVWYKAGKIIISEGADEEVKVEKVPLEEELHAIAAKPLALENDENDQT